MGNILNKKNASPSSDPSSTNIPTTNNNSPKMSSENQAEVVLVGCGAPNRGMGWWHAVQMLKGQVPHAKLCHVVEPWFLGPGT
jgi:hypothetical protein